MTPAPGTTQASLVDEHGVVPGRVHVQELVPALPGPLLDQLRLQPELGEHEPHEARVRAEGVMMEDRHAKARELARRGPTGGRIKDALPVNGW